MPLGLDPLDFFSLGHTLVTSIAKHIGFLTMDQIAGLRHIVDVGGRAYHGINQTRVGVHANVRVHAEMPLVSLLGLVHLGVALPVLVLGRAGRRNQVAVHHRAFAQHQAFVGELGVGGRQDFFSELMLFQQVTEAHDADAVGSTLDADQPDKLTVQRGLEQSRFHRRVGQTEPLLAKVNAHYGFQLERPAPGLGSRRNQRQHLRPRHPQIHLVQKHRLAGAALVQVQTKVLLLHGNIVRRRGMVHWPRATEF